MTDIDVDNMRLEHAIFRIRENSPDSPAILGPGASPLSYEYLAQQIEYVAAWLADRNIDKGTRIASALEDGAMAATAFLAFGSSSEYAPLNPDLTEREFSKYLKATSAQFLLVPSTGADAPKRAALALCLPVIELLEITGGAAGQFELSVDSPAARTPRAASSDVALVLQTSGTTGRPKVIPLTHQQLYARGQRLSKWLSLTPSDRCLAVTPCYHVHAIAGCIVTSILSGASIVCPPRFEVGAFYRNFREFAPTWFSAGSTFYRAILAERENYADNLHDSRLRFVRHASDVLTVDLRREIEQAFNCPMQSSYGSTEGNNMIGDPLPPGVAKPGSIGIPFVEGEFAIMNDAGELLEADETGEIVIRGPCVFTGYENDPAATTEAFHGDWARTGDFGLRDTDGHYFITGRKREIINRGGQVIAPIEIETALNAHPSVSESVVFPLPHQTLGEQVAAAIVAESGHSIDTADLLNSVGEMVAAYKRPTRLIVVTEIPKTAAGKVRRNLLAKHFEDRFKAVAETTMPASPETDSAPRTPTETALTRIWRDILRLDQVGPLDKFFELGGDSLALTQILLCVERDLGVTTSMEALFAGDDITIRSMATAISRTVANADDDQENIVDLPFEDAFGGVREIRAAPTGSETESSAATIKNFSRLKDVIYTDKELGLKRFRANTIVRTKNSEISINSLGFRGPEITRPKLHGVFRLAVLGASSALDAYSSNNETWLQRLVDNLASAFPHRAFDYVNAGFPAHGVTRSTLQFERQVRPLSPDLIIIWPAANLNTDTAILARRKELYGGRHYAPSRLARRSLLLMKVEMNLIIKWRQLLAHRESGKLQVGDDISQAFEARLERLVASCRRDGLKVVLIGMGGLVRADQPPIVQMAGAAAYMLFMPYLSIRGIIAARDAFNRSIESVARRNQALYVNSEAVPATRGNYADSAHFSRAGSAAFAALLTNHLLGDPEMTAVISDRGGSSP